MGVAVLAEIWAGKDKIFEVFFFFFFFFFLTRWMGGKTLIKTWRVAVVGWQWYHSKDRISAVQMVVV
jgi:hypothetical protein